MLPDVRVSLGEEALEGDGRWNNFEDEVAREGEGEEPTSFGSDLDLWGLGLPPVGKNSEFEERWPVKFERDISLERLRFRGAPP
jgi:hypothetical protein